MKMIHFHYIDGLCSLALTYIRIYFIRSYRLVLLLVFRVSTGYIIFSIPVQNMMNIMRTSSSNFLAEKTTYLLAVSGHEDRMDIGADNPHADGIELSFFCFKAVC